MSDSEDAARERKRRRAEREARRTAGWTPKDPPPNEPRAEELSLQRRKLLADRVQRRLARARLAHPDPSRKPLRHQRDAVRRRRIAILVGVPVALALVAGGLVALAHRLEGGTVAPAPPPGPTLPSVTIPEGLDRSQIAKVARHNGIGGDYEQATLRFKGFNPSKYGGGNAQNLEGFLFPDTFELPRRPSVDDLIERQLADFEQRMKGVDMSYAESKNLTTFDVLTIASMIEREVSADKERALVAAVIYNRLHAGMPLQIDATIRFAEGNYDEPLGPSDLALDSPYNTYANRGLPPGPISNPGLASIEAAANPADVAYLYYVVEPGTCEHNFATTDAEFQQYQAEYNAARAAAGGKSPTPANC